MAAVLSSVKSAPHLHVDADRCPTCDQPIPNERLAEVRARIATKERELQARADARTKEHVEAVRAQGEAAVEALKEQFHTREEAARKDGETRAATSYEKRLTEAAEAARVATKRGASLELELAQSKQALSATVDKLTADFVKKEEAARAEARSAAVKEMNAALVAANTAKAAAEAKAAETEAQKIEVEQKVVTMQASQEALANERIAEAREAMEKHNQEVLNKERAKSFEENQKLQTIVDDLKRKLEKKTANELGEGAEVDLVEALKAQFPDDDIKRVARGKPGADVIQTIKHKGADRGVIVYDSKNHRQWRNDFVTKLRADQVAVKAQHAVLSTHAFPQGKKQLDIEGGVILANPARVVIVAHILRQQIIQVHALKSSNEERDRKTEELYRLMTSERFELFLGTITRAARQLIANQEQERKQHEVGWRKEGEIYQMLLRTCSTFDDEIARIIGAAPAEMS